MAGAASKILPFVIIFIIGGKSKIILRAVDDVVWTKLVLMLYNRYNSRLFNVMSII